MSKRPIINDERPTEDEERSKPKPRAKSYGLGLLLRGDDTLTASTSTAASHSPLDGREEDIPISQEQAKSSFDGIKSPSPKWLPTLPKQTDQISIPFLESPLPPPPPKTISPSIENSTPINMDPGNSNTNGDGDGDASIKRPIISTPTPSTENSTLPPLTPNSEIQHFHNMSMIPEDIHRQPSPTGSSFTFTSSMQHAIFREDEGRLYNAIQDDYALPADTEEIQRLDIQHHAIRLLFGGNYLPHVGQHLRSNSPLGKDMRVLDLGCGTGTWCLEMAREFPEAEFIGIDLVPIQPDVLPDNCSFVMDDITKGLPYPDGTFDLVTGRLLVMGLRDYPSLLRDVARVIKPGGMFVATEPDINLVLTPDQQRSGLIGWNQWERGLQQAMTARGTDPHLAPKISQYLTDTGSFGVVDSLITDWPLTPWSHDPKQRTVGSVMIRDIRQFPDTSRLLIIDGAGISPMEYDRIKIKFLQEIEMNHKIVWRLWSVWGVKSF